MNPAGIAAPETGAEQGRTRETSRLGFFVHCTSTATFALLVSAAPEPQIALSTTKDKPSKNSVTATKKRQGDPAPPSQLFPERIKQQLKAAASCSFTKSRKSFTLRLQSQFSYQAFP